MLLLPLKVAAFDIHPLLDIEKVARAYLKAQLHEVEGKKEVDIAPMDKRLRLAYCNQPLEVFTPSGSRLIGNTTVGVQCTTTSQSWTIYLPATIRLFQTIAVATHPLERGTIIKSENIAFKSIETTGLRDTYFLKADYLVGKQLIRRLAAHDPFGSNAIKALPLIKRGEQISILATQATLQIRMTGEALSDGVEGDLIRVKNHNSNRIIEGRVTTAGEVEVHI